MVGERGAGHGRAAGVAVAALVLGLVAGCGGGHEDGSLTARASRTATPTPPAASSTFDAGHQLGSRSAKLGQLQAVADRAPVRLAVPRLKVDAPVQSVGTDPRTKGMALPSDVVHVAWWSLGSRPGDAAGTMVLAAHVDWNHVEGLFFHLDTLRPGDVVTVVTAAGERRPYRVQSSRRLPKLDLAGQQLFTGTGPARLALITCGGQFDYAAHSYRDNVIVYATPAS